MSGKPLSDRLRGLKFMQRGAQRGATGTPVKTESDSKPGPAPLTPEPAVSTDKDIFTLAAPTYHTDDTEHWVVPMHQRTSKVAESTASKSWGAFYQEAVQAPATLGRQQYGAQPKATKRHAESEDEFDSASDEDDAADSETDSSSDESDEPVPKKPAPAASLSKPRSRPLHAGQTRTFQKPPSAAGRPSGKKRAAPSSAAPRRKTAAVADRAQSLRRKR